MSTPTESALVTMWEIPAGEECALYQMRATEDSPLITGEVIEINGKKFVVFKNSPSRQE